jgi:hypothetical protein
MTTSGGRKDLLSMSQHAARLAKPTSSPLNDIPFSSFRETILIVQVRLDVGSIYNTLRISNSSHVARHQGCLFQAVSRRKFNRASVLCCQSPVRQSRGSKTDHTWMPDGARGSKILALLSASWFNENRIKAPTVYFLVTQLAARLQQDQTCSRNLNAHCV